MIYLNRIFMELQTIHCFLVHPAKKETEQPQIGGANVPKQGKLFSMLNDVFQKAEKECAIEICFNPNSKGEQQNECRDLLMAYLERPHVDIGRKIAIRLQGVTTHKSGLGLLFLMSAHHDGNAKLVLSRFPADQGIWAEEKKDNLTVEFLEKVFMKSATAYKSGVYSGKVSDGDFWLGRVIDKQINHSVRQFANYWIRDFLASELRTTPAAGSKRLAVALKEAMLKAGDTSVKTEIAAAVTLAGSVKGQTLNAEEFCARFGLSDAAKASVRQVMKEDSLMAEKFQFDAEEFKRHIAFRSIELNNGGTLTAPADRWNDVFRQDRVEDDEYRFTTQGQIIDQRLRRQKT